MAVRAVVLDAGETLAGKTRSRERGAEPCGVPQFTLTALVGSEIACCQSDRKGEEWLDSDPRPGGQMRYRALRAAAPPEALL